MGCLNYLKCAKHAVNELKYNFVWFSKYRKLILRGKVDERLKGVFKGITAQYVMEIDAMEVVENHVYTVLQSSLKYGGSQEVCSPRFNNIRKDTSIH